MPNVTVHEGRLPERIVALDRPEAGLKGYIALHSTLLGPAAGGCRLWRYPDTAAACADAARLAEGMALKNALAGLPLGGGKAVLMEPEGSYDRKVLMQAFGAEVERLAGQYITAEDVGTSPRDMLAIARQTAHVAGLPSHGQGPSGDPSPWTALGTFEAMKVAVGYRLGRDLSEVTVAVQGLGNVGMALARLLRQAGARLVVTDIRSERVAEAAVELGAATFAASPSALSMLKVDVLAPCALGGVLTPEVAEALSVKVVCGAANNQLAAPHVADRLQARGILYAPDFLVNAGGIINVAGEYFGWTSPEVEARVGQIGSRLNEVLTEAAASGRTPVAVAEARARALLVSGRRDSLRPAA